LIVFAVTLLAFLVHAYRIYGTDVSLIDDAFIFFRYAVHWAEGQGVVWNLGGPPVEGVSSLLYTALLAAGVRLGAGVLLWATVLNLLLAGASLALVIRLTLRMTPAGIPPSLLDLLIPAFLLALSPPFAFWTGAGMDTLLFTFLLLLATFYALQAHDHIGRCMFLGATYALLGMARLDALPLFLYTLIALPLAWKRPRPLTRRCLKRVAFTFLVLFVPFYLARWFYFGWPFPNSFYAKMGGGGAAWREGIAYVLAFLRQPATLPLLVLALLGALYHPRWQTLYTGGLVFLLFLRAVAAGGDWMPHYRFMVPVLPLLLVLAALGLRALTTTIVRERRCRPALQAVLGGLLALLLLWPSLRFVARTPWRLWRPLRLLEPMHASQYAMGMALRARVCPQDRIALLAVGAAAYLNDDHIIIDMLGLNDVHIAHSPPVLYKGRWDSGHVRLDVDYLLAQRPEWIQLDTHLFSDATFHLRDWMPPQRLWANARLRSAYRLLPLRVTVPSDTVRPKQGVIFFLHRRDAPICGRQAGN